MVNNVAGALSRPVWLNKPLNLLVATALFCVLAIAGNALAVPLFYSIQFIFGSVFVFIAMTMLGTWPAVIVAAAGGLYTWVLWGHPYALMVFVAECLFVVWVCRRAEISTLLADGTFWFVIGIPATLLLYIFALGVELQTAFLMALKQMLNGVFNAAVAGIFLFFLQLYQRRISAAYLVSGQIKGIIFHTTLMIALVAGSIPILQFAQFKQDTHESRIEHQLTDYLNRVSGFLRNNPEYSEQDWNRFRAELPGYVEISVTPADSSTPAVEQGLELQHRTSPDEPSKIKSWKQGNYLLSSRVEGPAPVDVVIRRSSRSVSEEMDRISLDFLGYLGVLLVLAIAVARVMSDLLTRPIWRLSTVLNSSTNGIITTDVSGRTEWINGGFSRLSGYSIEEMRGKRPGELLQGEGTDRKTVARIRDHLARQESFEEEILNYNSQGQPYWIRINCEPLRSENGQISGYIAVKTDITEQRKIAQLEKVGSAALRRIAESETIDETLVTLARNVESLTPGIRCAIELESPLLSDHCDVHFACYLAINHQPGGLDWKQAETSPTILDGTRQVIGRIHAFHQESYAWSANDEEVFRRAANIVSVVIERYYAEYKLRESASVFRFANEGIMLTDASGIVVDCNNALTDITGLQVSDVRGRQIRELLCELEEVAELGNRYQQIPGREQWVSDTWIRHPSGQRKCVRQSVSTVKGKQGAIHRYVYIFNDISEMKEYESQLENMAKFDPLTGLPNRALLSDRLQQAMIQCDRTGTELAVFFIDLDGFKQVNDRHGHAVGDQLLKTVAGRLKGVMREGDTLARFGGDEFVVVVPLTFEVKSCQLLLDRILEVVSRSSRVLGEQVTITASIGVTVYPQPEQIDADQLLRQADQAMYSAKQSGKNQCFYYDADSERAIRDLFDDLKRIETGLARNEFVLFYQPKVQMTTGELIGVEALIRWQHPERGMLPPGEFLPVIEQHALSVTMGEWVIRAALEQQARWRQAGLTIPVSVNIDPFHLAQKDFVLCLAGILADFPGLKPGDLEIEIVESSSLEDLEAVSRVINDCKQLGVRFALDDFGTGYSSLTYLRQLPLDSLKIDRSFVQAMLDSPGDMSIVKGVLGLAKSFNLPVIAEGVETAAHYDALISLGCDSAQGFWLSRPIPGDSLLQWAQSDSALPQASHESPAP
jgi:diguanylate cyclase (GGDEF)-like protein/PAS domain S-box-containing protein